MILSEENSEKKITCQTAVNNIGKFCAKVMKLTEDQHKYVLSTFFIRFAENFESCWRENII